jgi:hypothetical protein
MSGGQAPQFLDWHASFFRGALTDGPSFDELPEERGVCLMQISSSTWLLGRSTATNGVGLSLTGSTRAG